MFWFHNYHFLKLWLIHNFIILLLGKGILCQEMPGGTWVLLEKAMAPHSSTLAWKIPWTEEPGRLQSMGSLRVGHDWVTSLSLFTFTHWRRKWPPTPVFLPGESQGRGSLVSCHLWCRTESTWLKQLSSTWVLYWFFFKANMSHRMRPWGKVLIDMVSFICFSCWGTVVLLASSVCPLIEEAERLM